MSPIPPTLDTATFEQLVLEAFSELNGIDYSKPILDTADYRHRVLYALQYMVLNPNNGGGGGAFGAVYYFNRSIPSSISGYYEMSKNLVIGAGTTLTATGAGTQLVGSFATVLNNPNVTTIPSGNWNFENYVSMNSNGGTPKIYGEIYVRNLAGTETLIATNISNPHAITDGTVNELYLWSIPVPATNILATDRLVVKFYALDLGGRTMTMHFEDANVAQATTSLPSVDLSAYVLKAGDTMTGKLTLPASTTASAPLKIPHGLNPSPTTPQLSAAGDIWLNEGIRYRDQIGTIRFVADINRPNDFTQRQTISADSFTTLPALKITQLGSGEALRVEDDTTPDATAFVVSANGKVGIGVAPDTTVALKVDATGIKFSDNSIQTTAAGAGSTALIYQATYYKNANQPLVINGSNDITFDENAAWNNPNGYITHTDGSGDFTVVQAGLYQLELNVSVNANSATWNTANNKVISIDIARFPTAEQVVIGQTAVASTTQNYTQSLCSTFNLEAGDIINLRHYGLYATAIPFIQGVQNTIDLNTWFTWRYISFGPQGPIGPIGPTGPTGPAIPYASGNKVVKRFVLAPSSATGTTTTTASTAGDRGYFYLDLGDITKWNPTNASTPVINFYIYGSISSAAGGAQATFSLHRKDTSATITGSTLSTTSSALTILSATLLQSDFPSAPTVIALQYFRDGGSGGTVNFSNAVIEAVWTVN